MYDPASYDHGHQAGYDEAWEEIEKELEKLKKEIEDLKKTLEEKEEYITSLKWFAWND